jgi:hypothetical protein
MSAAFAGQPGDRSGQGRNHHDGRAQRDDGSIAPAVVRRSMTLLVALESQGHQARTDAARSGANYGLHTVEREGGATRLAVDIPDLPPVRRR